MYPVNDYKIISFHKSDNPLKKYYVIIENNQGEQHKIYFGAIKPDGTPYQQYKDLTPLGLYKQYDHNDRKRMLRYVKRHEPFDLDYITPNTLSLIYLWAD